MKLLSGHARLAGVFGHPVTHSRSPRLHGFWLQRYGIDGAYIPLGVAPDRFGAAVRALVDLGFRGAKALRRHAKRDIGAVNAIALQPEPVQARRAGMGDRMAENPGEPGMTGKQLHCARKHCRRGESKRSGAYLPQPFL